MITSVYGTTKSRPDTTRNRRDAARTDAAHSRTIMTGASE